MKSQISRSVILLALAVVGVPALQAQGDPPVPRGTWTETREDAPGVIFIHRRGEVIEATLVPGTGVPGIPPQFKGPAEVSMKWVGPPVAWPPGVIVEEENVLCDDVVRIRVAGDAEAAANELTAMPEVLFAYPVEFAAPLFSRVLPTDRLVLRLAAGKVIEDVTVAHPVEVVAPMLDSTVEYVVRLLDPKAATPDDVATAIEGSGLVEWIQRDCIRDAEFFFPPSPPNDANYPTQWHLDAVGQTIGLYTAPGPAPNDIDVNAPAAWNATIGNPGVKVAVIDDAFETTHPDLNLDPAAIDYFNYPITDPNVNPDGWQDMHGTPCAGIVGAVTNNGSGVAGMAPACPVVPIKVNSMGNMPYDSTVGNSIRYAAQNADIISCSWGYVNPAPVSLSSTKYALQFGAGGRGSVVFFATGNEAGFTWHAHTFNNPGGSPVNYDIRWSYVKDGSVSDGLDQCFVDSVYYYPAGTAPSVELFDSLVTPALPTGWTSSGGTWASMADFLSPGVPADIRAESGTQFIGSPAITHNQSTNIARTISVPPGGGTIYYVMRVDAQPSTWAGNVETTYDVGQFEYRQSGSGSWTVAHSQGGQPNVISYPAADPETIAVGANDTTGRRSYYSQWGSALDFVAPSDGTYYGLGIATTDLTGAAPADPLSGISGYDSGSYCQADQASRFGGTSAACPLAAGVGALVRSVNLGLSPAQVRNLLRATAIQVDPAWYTYVGGRCDQVGFGQVDAQAAVAAAGATMPIAQMSIDLKITEVSPIDGVCPYVEIFNNSPGLPYVLDDVMLTDCETGGDVGESALRFPPGTVIPPQGTIVVALGQSTPPFVAELTNVLAGGGAAAGGLQLFECLGSGLVFNAQPVPVMLPVIPVPTITLSASDNVALAITPGMMASYLPDVIDGMSFGMPAVSGGGVIGVGPGIPEAGPALGGATPALSYQRSGSIDTDVSVVDFTVVPRTPGRIVFGTPVQSLDPIGLTSSEIEVGWMPAVPGDHVVIVASSDTTFAFPVHGTMYNPGDPFGADFVVWSGPGPAFIDAPHPPSTAVHYRAWTMDPTMNYSAGLTAAATTLTPPVPLPLVDSFTAAGLSGVIWPQSLGASIDAGVLSVPPQPSPPNCARLDSALGAPFMACQPVDPGVITNVLVRYFFQEGGNGDPPEPGEDLIVECLDPGRVWQQLMMHPATGPMPTFHLMEIPVPAGWLHSEFRVRFRTTAVSSGPTDTDDWFIDDFSIEAVDSDNDGMEDRWELAFFPNLTTANATSDWDKDGFSDLSEWTAGTDPTDPSSLLFLKITKSSTTPGQYDFEWPSVSGSLYHVQTCSDLQSWTDKATNISPTPPKNTWSDTPASAPTFYRLRVTR